MAEPIPTVRSLLGAIDEPTPATEVRMILGLCRNRGLGFEAAWSHALRCLPRTRESEEWRYLLHRSKVIWRTAYEQVSAPQSTLAGGGVDDAGTGPCPTSAPEALSTG